jgi:6-phosphogluconate dehydrogenase
MGRNLLLNMADHGYKVAGHDKDQSKIDLLTKGIKQGKCYRIPLGK